MAERANARLVPFGKTIDDAADFLVKHLSAIEKSAELEKAMNELIESRKATGASKRYRNDLKLRLGRFCKQFPDRRAAEITTAEVDSWLAGLALAPVTRNTFRRDLRTLFSFCMTRGYCASNPVTNVKKAKEVEGDVGILTVEQTAELLKAASDQILPYFAIGAFAGLRAAELQRLTWDEIDFRSKLIEVKSSKSKTAQRRFVHIRPNLRAWIFPYRKSSGQVSPVNLRKLELEVRERAKIKEWPPNALRHSYASYHLAHFKDAAALALQMGHTNSNLVFQHYRQLVKPKEAARYWQIKPEKKSNKKIVQFAA
jgi:integrase